MFISELKIAALRTERLIAGDRVGSATGCGFSQAPLADRRKL
jgi:hypothetical protein